MQPYHPFTQASRYTLSEELKTGHSPSTNRQCTQMLSSNDVDKAPFFGGLPVIGNVFKRRTKQDDRIELLMSITPKIMDASLDLR